MDEPQTAAPDPAIEAEEASQVIGLPGADEVVARVSALSDVPVAEHVAVFEAAHEQLRRMLDAQPDT